MYVHTLYVCFIPITFECVTTYYQTLQTWIGDNATCYHNFKALPRICLARNNNTWPTKEIDLHLKTPEDPLVYQNLSSTPSKASSLKINSPLPVGFINKGNTCYANAILQTLSVFPSLWNRVSSESQSLSSLKSITEHENKI